MSSVSASLAATKLKALRTHDAHVCMEGPTASPNDAVQAKVTSMRAWFMRELWLANKWCTMLSRCQNCSNMQVSRHLSSCWVQWCPAGSLDCCRTP